MARFTIEIELEGQDQATLTQAQDAIRYLIHRAVLTPPDARFDWRSVKINAVDRRLDK